MDIGEGLEALQAAVGGDIQAVYPYDDPVALICNEEGKYMGLPLNRALRDDEGNIYDIIAGNFFLCGLGEENFADLPADLMEKYRQQFEHPEQFVRIAGKILAVRQPVPSPEEQEAQRAQMAVQEAQREEMRLDDSTDLAFDLDVFLRQYSGAYADMHPDFHEEKERMADELLSGQTGKIRMRMATVIQEEHLDGEAGPLLDRIAAYEKEYGISAYSISSQPRDIKRRSSVCLLAGWKRKGSRLTGIITKWSMRQNFRPAKHWKIFIPALISTTRRQSGMYHCGSSSTTQRNRRQKRNPRRRRKRKNRKGADDLC